MQMNLAHRRAKNCTSWEYYVRRSGKRVWVQVTARKFNFSVPTFAFHLLCGWQKFSIEFFCRLEIFLSLLICVSRRTRIFVFAQRNALKKVECRSLPTFLLILQSECVVSQIFAFADKEMFYLRNAKHDTFTPKTLFDTLLEGWQGEGTRSALPCSVVKFNSPSYMLMMFAGNLRACVKSVIKYLTHFPRGDYRHFCRAASAMIKIDE